MPGGMTAAGTWEGDKLVFEGDGFRMTYTNITPTSRTLTSEMGQGGSWKKGFTIHYKKESSATKH